MDGIKKEARAEKNNMRRLKKGFTLIELIIVVIIVGILASIVAPMLSYTKDRAICAEAVAGMSAVRLSMQQYYLQYGDLPPATQTWQPQYFPGLRLRTPGTNYPNSDLDGIYFSQECYYIWRPSPGYDYVVCYLDAVSLSMPNIATNNSETKNIADVPDNSDNAYLSMRYQTGKLGQIGVSRSGLPYGGN